MVVVCGVVVRHHVGPEVESIVLSEEIVALCALKVPIEDQFLPRELLIVINFWAHQTGDYHVIKSVGLRPFEVYEGGDQDKKRSVDAKRRVFVFRFGPYQRIEEHRLVREVNQRITNSLCDPR